MRHKTYISIRAAALAGCLLVAGGALPAGAGTPSGTQVKQTAERAVAADAKTQAAMEAWLAEERQLHQEIEALENRLQRETWHKDKATTYRVRLEAKVADLGQRAAKMERIELELLPLLDETLQQLRDLVESDLPDERTARRQRLAAAEKVLDDYDARLLEKARAVFDALAREADRGHGVAVKDDEIMVDGHPRRVKLLRVGGIGLWAMTLDARNAYAWDRTAGHWQALDGGCQDIRSAMEIAAGMRLVELSCLPVGPPAAAAPGQGGDFENH